DALTSPARDQLRQGVSPMTSLPAPRPPLQPKPPRKPPRPPQSHAYDRATRSLTVTDCNGAVEVYRVVALAPDFGRAAVELVITGSSRFGTFYHAHRDDDGSVSCTCPGYVYAGVCKHLRSLEAEGLL